MDVEALAREEARNKGLVVIEPGPPEKVVCLDEDEHALVELRNLLTLQEKLYWYAVVVTAKTTGVSRVVLKANCYKDATGHYFAFPSEAIVVEAISCAKAWVEKHLAVTE